MEKVPKKMIPNTNPTGNTTEARKPHQVNRWESSSRDHSLPRLGELPYKEPDLLNRKSLLTTTATWKGFPNSLVHNVSFWNIPTKTWTT